LGFVSRRLLGSTNLAEAAKSLRNKKKENIVPAHMLFQLSAVASTSHKIREVSDSDSDFDDMFGEAKKPAAGSGAARAGSAARSSVTAEPSKVIRLALVCS